MNVKHVGVKGRGGAERGVRVGLIWNQGADMETKTVDLAREIVSRSY